jgi:hypothetical protein
MGNRHTRALLLLLLSALSTGLLADEVTDQIGQGLEAYKAGDLRQAMEDLKYAIAQVQERLNTGYVELLPRPLPGWQADTAEAQSAGMAMMGGGTQFSRTYRSPPTGESVTVRMTADSPMLQAMGMMLSNPMVIGSQPGTKLYRHGRHRGTLKHEPEENSWEISLMVGSRLLVQVEGKGMKSQEPVETYLKTIDMAAVEKAFGI